jgi:hypothetical protein
VEKKLKTSEYSDSYIKDRLIMNQNINGINVTELHFKNNHFFVALFILNKKNSPQVNYCCQNKRSKKYNYASNFRYFWIKSITKIPSQMSYFI